MDSSCKQHCTSLRRDRLEAFAKGSWVSKAPDLLSSKTASYHSNTKGHGKSLQPLSAKGINVQTKPLAVSKINCCPRSPGLQRATYALHRNTCLHVGWAAAKSCEPNKHSPFDHRNATLINCCDTISLKALKISTGRSREGFSPASPFLYCSLRLVPTSNRCQLEK